jgi:hypothetical protein
LHFLFDLYLKPLDFFDVKHTLSPFILQGSLKISNVAVSSHVLLFVLIKFLLLFVQHLLELLDSVLVDSAFPPFVVELALQEVDLVLSELDGLSSFVKLFLFSISLIILSLKFRFKFSDGSFISQTFLPLSVQGIGQIPEVALQRIFFVLVLIDNLDFLSKEVLEPSHQVLICCAFTSFLIDLLLQEPDLLIVHVTLSGHVIDLAIEVVGLFDF